MKITFACSLGTPRLLLSAIPFRRFSLSSVLLGLLFLFPHNNVAIAQTTAPPDGIIDSPAGNVTIAVGQSVTFMGTGRNSSSNLPLSFFWNFGGGAPNTTAEDPGDVTFSQVGAFTVSFTVTDSQGIADPTPAMVTITVNSDTTVIDPPPSPVAGRLQALVNTRPRQQVARTIELVCPRTAVNPALPPNSADLQRDCNAVVGAGVGNDQGASANAIAQITPDQAAAPTDAAQSGLSAQLGNIASRVQALQAGVTGISIANLNFNLQGQNLSGQHLAALYGTTGGGASDDDSIVNLGRLGIFVNGNVVFGDKDGTDNEEGYDFDTQGITVGADYRVNENLVLGGAVGYMNTETDLDLNGGDLDTDGLSATLYGTYYQSDRFYVDGSITYASNDYDQKRRVVYTLPAPNLAMANQTLSADYDGDQIALSLGGGYEINQGALSYGPTARIEYVNLDIDSYSEKASNPGIDGSGWIARMDDQEYESLTLSLGGQATYAVSYSWGVLVPQVNLEYVHEFDDDSRNIDGQFVGDPSGTTFSLPTDSADQNYFNLGLGASAIFTQGRSAFLFYRGVLGYEDVDQHSISAGVRMEF